MQSKNTIRLNKFIAESGICSRREADRHIQAGRVLINRKKANIGDLVHNNDKVIVNGLHLEPRIIQDNIYIALNKPVGITSTTEETTPGNIINHVNHSTRIFPIGRLDKDSQGLILLTNDGDILNKILRAENAHEKEYLVTVSTPITDQFITTMANGIPILGGTTKKCHVEKISPYIFKIILIQGLNRQIRRMCEHLQYTVTKLERTRIMNITIKGIPPGEWRDLTKTELNGILKLIENSTSQSHSTQHQEKPKPTKIFHKTKPPYQSKTTHRNEATPPKRKDKKDKPTDRNRPTQKTRRRR